MSWRAWLLSIASLGLLLALAACGGEEKARPVATAPPAAGAVEVTAQNISFSTDTIRADPGKSFTIRLTNNDSVAHNLHIYKQKGGESITLINPARVDPGQVGVLTTTIQQQGEYYFQCDLHPSISGKVLVGRVAAAPGGGASPTPGQGGDY